MNNMNFESSLKEQNCIENPKLKKKVAFNHDLICNFGDKEIEKMKSENIYRYCLHENVTDKVHEMINVYDKFTYVRPHYHPDKGEMKIILEGELLCVIYDMQGRIQEHFILSNKPGACKITHLQPNVVHTDIPLTDVTIYLEVKPGPFVAEKDNIFLDGFPDDASNDDVEKYVESVMNNGAFHFQ